MKNNMAWLKLVPHLVIVLMSMPIAALAQGEITCESTVVVQADDWLSNIAEKTYGNVAAYTIIAEATNAQASVDNSFAFISNPNFVEPGWKICLPSAADVEARLSVQPTAGWDSRHRCQQRPG